MRGSLEQPVPVADAADNVYVDDVIGNKEDAAAETVDVVSLVGLARAIIARFNVTAADAVLNVDAPDVIGNKEDVPNETVDVASLVALARALVEKSNGAGIATYPDAAAGAALTAGAANVYGALVAVSGALGVASLCAFLDFDTPAVAIEPVQWELSYNAGANIVATGMINFDTAVGTYPPIDLTGKCGIIPAGETLQLRIRSATGGTTCNAHLSTQPALP